MLFTILTGWSSRLCAEEIQLSSNTQKPEHVYRVRCARQNQTKFWSKTGAPVDEAEAGNFALVAAEREGDYYIFNVDNREYISYTPSNVGNKRNFSVNVAANPQPWKFTSAKADNIQFYQIQPYNGSGTAEKYVNWYQGISGTHNGLGLWEQDGTQDKGSSWAFEEVDFDPSIYSTAEAPKYYMLKNLRQNKYADSQTEGATITEEANMSAGSIWRFEDATSQAAANMAEGTIPCYIYNEYVGKYLTSHSTTTNGGNAQYAAAPSQVWYLIPHTKDNKTGFVISKNATMSAQNDCWNDNSGKFVCAYKGDDAGSIWQYVRYFGTKNTYTIRLNTPDGYTGEAPTVAYAGKTYKNADTFVGFAAPAPAAFTASGIKGYYPTVSINNTDIVISYAQVPTYTVYSDGMPESAYITIAGEQYRNVNAQGETTVDGSKFTGLPSTTDVTATCGGGYDYKIIVDNLNAQITVNFTQVFLPTASVDAEKQNFYRIKDSAGRYPRISVTNILATKTKSVGDKFVFVEADEVGEYYIYDATAKKYLYYTQTTGTANASSSASSAIKCAADLASVPDNGGATWKIRKESYGGETVDIFPAKGSGSESWNFRGGDSYALNLYPAGDGNSSWTLEDPDKGSLACATYMFALPGAQYMHKLLPEANTTVLSITPLLDKDGREVATLTLHDDRVGIGNNYKYVTGTMPNDEGVYSYKAMLSDETIATISITVSKKLASPTPMMGWLSWNWFAENINTQRMTDIAQGMVDKGLVAAGYKYLVLDDGWGTSDNNNHTDKENLRVNTAKFADMKAFATSLNEKGIRLGLYSDAGSKTCGGFQPGSYNFETQHMQLFADCGADFLKYDFCNNQAGAKISYQQMGDAIRLLNAKRKAADPEGYVPFSLNACEWGSNQPWKWAAEAGADSWRSTQDARECWMGNVSNLIGVIDGVDRVKYLWMWAGVNRFNDLDMMCIGIHGYGGPSNHIPSHRANGGKIEGFTEEQARSQMSIWSMLASPLAITADVRKKPENYYGQTLPANLVSQTDLDILTNADIISISQDELGQQAEYLATLSQSTDNDPSGFDVYVKDLKDGEKALAVFNRGSSQLPARTIAPASVYLGSGETIYFKNVWTGATGSIAAGSNIQIPALKPYQTCVFKLRTTKSYNESTAIQVVEAPAMQTATTNIFDLQGRKVTEPTKGSIYLQAGKKVIF
ncbi:MAG: glycoside hydrolase family 27 protein [Bacteroidales bacterium]|nr:glycoside hydrolase family 27 protein [Candidatus Physcousia equi]